MYARIVAGVLRRAFDGLSAGDIDAITSKLAPDCVHTFAGDHALGGTRNTPASIRAWYERLLSLLGDFRADIRRMRVAGPPWATVAVVEWVESNSGADGVVTSAPVVNVIELRWGKATRVAISTDTAALERTLARAAAVGHPNALASPIEDPGASPYATGRGR